jgi:hypothetical protein
MPEILYAVVWRDEEDFGILVGGQGDQQLGRSRGTDEVCDEGRVVVMEAGIRERHLTEL